MATYICPKCHEKVNENDQVCLRCGSPVSEIRRAAEIEKMQRVRPRLRRLICLIIAAVLVIAGLAVLLLCVNRPAPGGNGGPVDAAPPALPAETQTPGDGPVLCVQHTFTSEVTRAADCCHTGVTVYTCSVCGYRYEESSPADPDAHSGYGTYRSGGIAATCTKPSVPVCEYCSGCGALLRSGDPEPPLGHVWGDWYTLESATSIREGKEQRLCIQCRECQERILPRIMVTPQPDGVKILDVTCRDSVWNDRTNYCQLKYLWDQDLNTGFSWMTWQSDDRENSPQFTFSLEDAKVQSVVICNGHPEPGRKELYSQFASLSMIRLKLYSGSRLLGTEEHLRVESDPGTDYQTIALSKTYSNVTKVELYICENDGYRPGDEFPNHLCVTEIGFR